MGSFKSSSNFLNVITAHHQFIENIFSIHYYIDTMIYGEIEITVLIYTIHIKNVGNEQISISFNNLQMF